MKSKKPKTKTFILKITTDGATPPWTKDDVYQAVWGHPDHDDGYILDAKVLNATASAIRKLGDEQT